MKTYSLTEWMQRIRENNLPIDSKLSERIINDDLYKWGRMHYLRNEINFPIEEHTDFSAQDFANGKVTEFFKQFADGQVFSIKAEPLKEHEDKLFRNRKHGATKEQCFEFVASLKPSPAHYKMSIWPTYEQIAGGIFVVTDAGIVMDIIRGPHYVLTQGVKSDIPVITLVAKWSFKHDDKVVEKVANEAALRVKTDKKIDYEKANGFVKGYFEFLYFDKIGLKFIDFSTNEFMTNVGEGLVEELKKETKIHQDGLTGMTASPGIAKGKAVIVLDEGDFGKAKKGDILVTTMTTPEFMPVLGKVAAIVTDFGGILCHAAIVARELKIPCIIGTKNATQVLKDGQIVEVDADKGIIKMDLEG